MKKMNSVLSIRPIVILLCVVFLVFVMCGSAVANEYYMYVPSTPDEFSGLTNATLKEALENPTVDIVVLTENVELNDDIIVNNSKILISYYNTGLSIKTNSHYFDIPAGSSLTIGTGMNDVNIYGGSFNHLFNVSGSLTINDKVNIYNNNVADYVILASGNLISPASLIMNGGTIHGNNVGVCTIMIENATFTMNNGKIFENSATYVMDGILVNDYSKFVMKGGEIRDNSGLGGGVGVLSNGVFDLNIGNITNNRGINSGVYVLNGGKFNMMSGGYIADNYVSDYGGGVSVQYGGTFIQNGGRIENNTAVKDGGGVYLDASIYGHAKYTMNGGTLNNNTAGRNGGGVYLETDWGHPTFTLSGGTISGNTANIGGAVYLSNYNEPFITEQYDVNYMEGADFIMTSGVIKNNRADIAGGVFVSGKQVKMPENRTKFIQTIFNMSGGSIINNTGSPVVVSAGKFVLNGGSITGNNNLTEPTIIVSNTLDIDPTLNVKYKGVFEMGGGKIYDNLGNHSYVQNNEGIVNLSGGSIYYTGVNNTSTGVENNGILSISGDAIISGFKNHGVINYGLLNVSGGNIKNNNAKNGGGIYSENSFVMSGGTVASNTASDYGGGIYTNDSFTMTGGKITGNHANYSGAVSFRNNFNMSGGWIYNNSALSGGAFSLTDIANTPMTFNLFGGDIGGNTAEDNSGILFTHGNFNLGYSGLINSDNNVLMGSSQKINVVSDLSEDSGVYSIIPMTNSQQTVAVISVPGKNATDFIGNFDLYYKNSPLSYYNTLETSGLNILTGHTYAPPYSHQVKDIPYEGYVTCSVTFEPMNGENATIKSVPINSIVSRPEDPVYGSADFLGWFTAYEYEWDFENDVVTSPLTLYAEWYGVPSQKVSPIAVPEQVTDTSEFKIPTILIAAIAAAVIAAGVVLTVVIIRKRRNSDDDYDDDE